MKVFICLFALIAVVSSSVLHAGPAVLSTGTSSSSRSQDAAGNYQFVYNEQHSTGGSSRQEAGSPGVATGSYTLNVADGRQRVVNYVADALGFRAAIATNEPGTAAQAPAATSLSSPYAPPQAPVPVVAAAPVAVAAPAVAVHAPAVVHHAAPVLHHAAPLVHAPVAVSHPVAVAHSVPIASSYSSVINHGVVSAPLVHHAPAVVAAPVLAHHAPVLAHAAPLLHHY